MLIADDQPDVIAALRLLVRQAGFDVDEATSINGIRERLAAGAYDLLLMDLNYARDTTSGIEGLDLIAELTARDHTLPIIVMTGWGTISTAVEAMRRGARTFVRKPWDNTALEQTIRAEIDAGITRREADAAATRERDDAQRIQRALLPSQMPRDERYDIAAIWQPALNCGGDCYDLLELGSGRLGLLVSDVAGKGVPAALLMANAQALLRAFADVAAPPHEVMAKINRSLCRQHVSGRFVTSFYGVLDIDAYRLTFTNAGHNPPLLVRVDGRVERLNTGGLVLGILDDVRYEQQTVELHRGDRLVLFTDGITEAEPADGIAFGDERLIDDVRAELDSTARSLVDRLMHTVSRFTGGAFQDDATVIAVRIR